MTLAKSKQDWILRAATSGHVERIEAYFGGHGYDMHRHDTYAIGRTLSGVQSFHYRRDFRHSLPGGTIVLHPDEPHDGQAGTEAGFHYRMIYVEPALIQQILGGRPLPFIAGGLSGDARLHAASGALLQNTQDALDPLLEDDALYDLAHALCAAAGRPHRGRTADYVAAERARHYIHASLDTTITLDALAAAAGTDRWSLSRDFRALYGTSPYRYVMLRRLDLARRLIATGMALADAAAHAGFTDQSHLTRRHVQTYGMPPDRWRRMLHA
ncbi:AraC family transcriptional regulator [Achromobacter sp. MY14]|uniref:AraC family transcriptional regulator n=1 Tax=Achromobacter TaxID=222 RepID=UPI000F8FB793|nr:MULTISPECIES: AraC family transcriptional regulator [Achromobacter]AZS81337.1 AraC family transcriptional regulator [Achromobacter spanius]MCD0497130.1 AraC family transcriptional regulator [Achromobacter sp. MY14]